MDEKQIQDALNELADQAIPTNSDPARSVRTRLEARPRPQGKAALRPRLGYAGLAAVLLILAGTIFFLTPSGRGVAQSVMRFFSVAESDTLPLPTGQPTEAPPPTRTPAPTQIAALQEVTPAGQALPPQSYPSATPAPQGNLTLDEAQALAGFELRVPGILPPGYRLDNVIYDPQTGEVMQFYGFHPYMAGEQFILHQRLSRPEDVIGASAEVKQLTIGGMVVEYVGGSWFNDASGDTETWQPASIFHTFCWMEGGAYFTLEILFDDNDTWSPAYWTEDGMSAMVEIVMGLRDDFPALLNANYLLSVEQAEQISGLDLLAPAVLPEGFIFARGVYDAETGLVGLFYQPEDGSRGSSGISLVIIQGATGSQPDLTWAGYPPEAVEAVSVGGSPAVFARGGLADGVYDPEAGLHLAWEVAGLSIHMFFSAPVDTAFRLDQAEMLAIAESMQ